MLHIHMKIVILLFSESTVQYPYFTLEQEKQTYNLPLAPRDLGIPWVQSVLQILVHPEINKTKDCLRIP